MGGCPFDRDATNAAEIRKPLELLSISERTTCGDRKSTRLNSSHLGISYAVFCLNAPASTYIYTLSLHDALPILRRHRHFPVRWSSAYLTLWETDVEANCRRSDGRMSL